MVIFGYKDCTREDSEILSPVLGFSSLISEGKCLNLRHQSLVIRAWGHAFISIYKRVPYLEILCFPSVFNITPLSKKSYVKAPEGSKCLHSPTAVLSCAGSASRGTSAPSQPFLPGVLSPLLLTFPEPRADYAAAQIKPLNDFPSFMGKNSSSSPHPGLPPSAHRSPATLAIGFLAQAGLLMVKSPHCPSSSMSLQVPSHPRDLLHWHFPGEGISGAPITPPGATQQGKSPQFCWRPPSLLEMHLHLASHRDSLASFSFAWPQDSAWHRTAFPEMLGEGGLD